MYVFTRSLLQNTSVKLEDLGYWNTDSEFNIEVGSGKELFAHTEWKSYFTCSWLNLSGK